MFGRGKQSNKSEEVHFPGQSCSLNLCVIWIYIHNPIINQISFKHFKFVYLCVKMWRRKKRAKLKRFTLVCCPQWLRWGWLCSQHIWPTPYHTPHKCAQTWIFVYRKFIAITFTYLHIEFLDDFINLKTIFGIKIRNISPKSPNDFVWEVRCANLNIVKFLSPNDIHLEHTSCLGVIWKIVQ